MSRRELLIFLATVAGVGLAVLVLLRSGSGCSQQNAQVTMDSFSKKTGIGGGYANESGVNPRPQPQSSNIECPTSIRQTQSRIDYYKSQIIHPVKLDTRCTLLVPTYKRVRMLLVLLDNYCVMSDSLEKIVVVWNDIKSDIPSSVTDKASTCGVELKVLHMKVNKLSNRFLPGEYAKEIKTECELIVILQWQIQ